MDQCLLVYVSLTASQRSNSQRSKIKDQNQRSKSEIKIRDVLTHVDGEDAAQGGDNGSNCGPTARVRSNGELLCGAASDLGTLAEDGGGDAVGGVSVGGRGFIVDCYVKDCCLGRTRDRG